MAKHEENGEETIHNTSDVNFAAYLAYKGEKMNGTSATKENGRTRVWFNFELDADSFKKHKDAYFGHIEPDSHVVAHKFFQERERMYSLMIQIRNSSNGNS
jgi:hypothetical protein